MSVLFHCQHNLLLLELGSSGARNAANSPKCSR